MRSNDPELTRNCPDGLNPPISKVVRLSSVMSNHTELSRTCPVVILPPASQWFEEVRCGRTTPNSLELTMNDAKLSKLP